MSIEYSKRVWANKTLKGGKLLVMLALADHADDTGECYPGMPLLIEKTRLTDRQLRRVLNALASINLITIEERAIGRGKKPHYKLFPSEKADNSTALTEKADILSQKSGHNVRNNVDDELKADISDNKSGHLLHGKADICDTNQSHVRREPSLEPSKEEREEEETQARDPLSVAWRQAYRDIEMPPKLPASLKELVAECGMAAAIHGIKASAAKKDGRNFRYIAECARNYIPPPPTAYVNGSGSYAVDVPGVYAMPPSEKPTPVALPPPMPTDDPWAVALAELLPTLSSQAALWLKDSCLHESGELAGEPLYRVLVSHPAANKEWLTRQAERVIRVKLSGLLGKRVLVEFVIAQQEPT